MFLSSVLFTKRYEIHQLVGLYNFVAILLKCDYVSVSCVFFYPFEPSFYFLCVISSYFCVLTDFKLLTVVMRLIFLRCSTGALYK